MGKCLFLTLPLCAVEVELLVKRKAGKPHD